MGVAKLAEVGRLTGMGPGLARQESTGRVFGWVGNRNDQYVWPKPDRLAGYLDPLLTLALLV